MSDSAELAATRETAPAGLTPLANHLLAGNAALELVEHAGSQTPRRFTDVSAELPFLVAGAAVYDLGFRTRIAVTGADRLRWLNGMVSNAVQSLAEGEGNYSLILNAQGRVQGDGYVYRTADALLIDTDRSQGERLYAHLDHFIIMDDVELRALDASTTSIGFAGPKAAQVLASLGLDVAGMEALHIAAATVAGVPVTVVRAYSVLVPRYEVWFAPEHAAAVWSAALRAGALPVGVEALESLRVLEGTPRYGSDITDRLLPQETGQARALNFNKGCYLGQEIVERIRSRATIHRRLTHFALDGALPAAGTELTTPAEPGGTPQKAAELTSVAACFLPGLPAGYAIGLARVEALERRLPLAYDGGTATPLDKPPSLP
jgi:folate-binding protein YgfZ